MGISFQSPFYLLLLIFPLGLIIWWWRTQTRVTGGKRYVLAALRFFIFLCLILALAGTQLNSPIDEETVVFVVDRSASMQGDAQALSFLKEAVATKQEEDRYAIISVGQEALVEQPLTTRPELGSFGTLINPHATNLAEGIRLGSGMIPSSARGKIVLITDGEETQGDVLTELKIAKERGIAVEMYSIQQEVEQEVLLSTLSIPEQLFKGEEFQVVVEVESTQATRGVLRLYEGNLEVGRQVITIERGQNRYLFQQLAKGEGFLRYRVELQADDDTMQVNNQGYAFTQVQGTPKVLVLEGQPGTAHNLVRALEAGQINVEVTDPALLPKEIEGYKQYASIILANVQATQLGVADMERIRTAVRDLGLGLMMTGGEQSFGMGGWFKTPIEEALPVSMDLKSKEELPSLGLMLVIDKSGSMSAGMGGPNKMELAKEAALRATEMLQEDDQLGVVAFDGSPWLVVEMQPLTNLEEIQEKIGSIYADGGTEIYWGLEAGYQELKEVNTQRKHIILLTDGQSGGYNDYVGLIEEMKDEHITLSTVAVGDDADTFLLEELAELGNGRYYFATDPESVPQIFTQETALASRTFIVEDPHLPQRVGAGDWTALRQRLPFIHAYVATSPKQTAELALISAQSDPLLARWQYGLGRAVAWTSDLEGKWSPAWVAWAENARFWHQLVSWTFPQINEGAWQVHTDVQGSKGRIKVTLPVGSTFPGQMEAVVLNQKLERETVTLKPVEPGVLQGEFTADEPGTYLTQVLQKEGEQIIASETAGLTLAYSPEYRLPQDGGERLQRLMESIDGEVLSSPKEVFTGSLTKKWDQQEISDWLLIVVTLLWPVDIALRRVQLPAQLIQRLQGILRRKEGRSAITSTRTEALSQLGVKKAAYQQRLSSRGKDALRERTRRDKLVPPEGQKQERANERSSIYTTQTNKVNNSNTKGQPAVAQEKKEDPFNRLLDAKRKPRR